VLYIDRGPVPHAVESFVFEESDEGTILTWKGELGTDLWALGDWWGSRIARSWERAVRSSLDAVAEEAERRTNAHNRQRSAGPASTAS
jgi:hypothetical protein